MIVLAAKALCYFAQGSDNVVGNLDSSRAQKIAIQRFPEIGIPGSYSNKQFLDSVEEAKRLRPRLFEKADWPLIIASENESLKALEKSLQSNDLNRIQEELKDFRFKDKEIEGNASKIWFLLSKHIASARNHEKNWVSISAAISALKKNAQTNESYVPFRSDDRSHLVKAENQRREAEELASRFKSQSEILRTEETRLRHEISELVSDANRIQTRIEGTNRSVATSKPVIKNDQIMETAEQSVNAPASTAQNKRDDLSRGVTADNSVVKNDRVIETYEQSAIAPASTVFVDSGNSKLTINPRGPKIHGLQLGMSYVQFCEIFKKMYSTTMSIGYVHSWDRFLADGFLITKSEKEIRPRGFPVNQEYNLDGYGLYASDGDNPSSRIGLAATTFVPAGPNGTIIYFTLEKALIHSLFKSEAMSYDDFCQKFIDSYGIPKLKGHKRGASASMQFTSPKGWKIILEGSDPGGISAIHLVAVPTEDEQGFGK